MAVDIERGVRDYLRGRSAFQAVAGQRAFFGMPDRVTYPLALVSRVGGGSVPGEAPLDQPLVEIDCRAETKAEASRLARVVCAEIEGMARKVVLVAAGGGHEGVVAYGPGDIESVIWGPDPSDTPRYVVTAAVTARAA